MRCRPAASGSTPAAPTACARSARSVRRAAGCAASPAPGPGGSPAPVPPRPRRPRRRAPGRTRGCSSRTTPTAPGTPRRRPVPAVSGTACGGRTTARSSRCRCRRRCTPRPECPASGHAVHRCRPDRAHHPSAVRPPGHRRRARHTPTPHPYRTRWPTARTPARPRPAWRSAPRPPPGRTRRVRDWTPQEPRHPQGPHCARKPCRDSNPLHIGANVRNSPTSCPAARRPPGTGEPAAHRPHGTPPREGISRAWCPCCGRSSATSRRRTAC